MSRNFPLVFCLVSTVLFADPKASTQAVKPAEPASTSAPQVAKADQDIIDRAKQELEKIKTLVDAGALPRTRLEMAELAVQDAEDEAVLRQSLYGKLTVNETSREEVQAMVSAAQRLYDRQKLRFDEAERLVDHGVTARSMLTPILEDLESRRKTIELAQSRARLWDELAAVARAEAVADARPGTASEFDGIKHRFDGKGSFTDMDLRSVETAFTSKFHKGLPISAFGETALHRSLGFDHRGRVDVAVNPDQQEGVWLRSYLESHAMPYFAFRAAVAGSATGAHIHMGPPSTRLFASAAPKLGNAPVHLVRAKAKTRRHTPATVLAD